MDLMGKDLMEYVNLVKMPVLALVAISFIGAVCRILSVLVGFVSVPISALSMNLVQLMGLGILLIQVCLAAYIGYILGKKAGTLMQCGISGAVFGLLAGIIAWGMGLVASIIQAIVIGVTDNLFAAITGILVGGVFSLLVFIGKTIVSAVMAVIGGLVAGAK